MVPGRVDCRLLSVVVEFHLYYGVWHQVVSCFVCRVLVRETFHLLVSFGVHEMEAVASNCRVLDPYFRRGWHVSRQILFRA